MLDQAYHQGTRPRCLPSPISRSSHRYNGVQFVQVWGVLRIYDALQAREGGGGTKWPWDAERGQTQRCHPPGSLCCSAQHQPLFCVSLFIPRWQVG